MKTSDLHQKTIDGLLSKRTPLQTQYEKLKQEGEQIRERHEDEIISGKSGGAAHDLRENRTAQEGLLNILEGIDKQITAAQAELAEARRREAAAPFAQQELQIWQQLAVTVAAIDTARAEVKKLRESINGGHPVTHSGEDLYAHIGFVGLADDWLRQAWDGLNNLNVRNPNKS